MSFKLSLNVNKIELAHFSFNNRISSWSCSRFSNCSEKFILFIHSSYAMCVCALFSFVIRFWCSTRWIWCSTIRFKEMKNEMKSMQTTNISLFHNSVHNKIHNFVAIIDASKILNHTLHTKYTRIITIFCCIAQHWLQYTS